jgi:hypothetical protein
MTVWYRLPSIDGEYSDVYANEFRTPGKSANNVLFNYFHNDLIPFGEWFVENNLSPKAIFQWVTNHHHWQIDVAVGFDIPEEYATMFRLKFGDGYRV